MSEPLVRNWSSAWQYFRSGPGYENSVPVVWKSVPRTELRYLGLIFPDQNQSENFGADLQSGPEISDHEQTIHISIFKYFDTLAF